MKKEITKDLQSIVVYKINPNEQELAGEVHSGRNVDGRIFINSKMYIVDHTLIIENEKEDVVGVFSLHHYYALEHKY